MSGRSGAIQNSLSASFARGVDVYVPEAQRSVDEAWTSLVVDYAMRLGLANDADSATKELTAVYNALRATYAAPSHTISDGANSVVWFPDWCVGSLFLLAGAQAQETLQLAETARMSGALAALSPLLAEAGESGAQPAVRQWHAQIQYATLAHAVDRLVQAHLPAVASAFRRAGLTSTSLVVVWLEQSFWNVLDWPNVRRGSWRVWGCVKGVA